MGVAVDVPVAVGVGDGMGVPVTVLVGAGEGVAVGIGEADAVAGGRVTVATRPTAVAAGVEEGARSQAAPDKKKKTLRRNRIKVRRIHISFTLL